jgi:monomeric sarcosine oxidase
MGLASAWELARRGHPVTVVEQHGLVHDEGSHGGHTRIIRQAYHEGSSYVPLVREADAQWSALAERTRAELLVRCGLLEFGHPTDPEYRAAIDVCEACDVEHERLDAAATRARWPIELPDDWTACFSPSGGYLRVRPCLEALATEARAHGAVLRTQTPVVGIEPGPAGVTVTLAHGEALVADRVVLTAGAWLTRWLPEALRPRVVRLRRVLAWTDPAAAHQAALARLPVWGAFAADGFFYGFPYNDEGFAGFKLACHTSRVLDYLDDPIDPDTVDRDADTRNLQLLEGFLARHIPRAAGPWVQTKVCLYTATPRGDFLIDRHPDDGRIVVAGGFSGHGFKFAPAIGRLVSELATSDAAPIDAFSFANL